MPTASLPPDVYYAGLPKIIAGAGVILHDEQQQILLVHPTYRTDGTWEIPGGGLDAGEHPLQAAAREAREELGVDLDPGRLLAVDWVPPQADGRPPLVNFLFDGGPVTEDWARATLRLDPGELSEWRPADPAEQQRLMAPHMARRLAACAHALTTGTTAYLHHGHPSTR